MDSIVIKNADMVALLAGRRTYVWHGAYPGFLAVILQVTVVVMW